MYGRWLHEGGRTVLSCIESQSSFVASLDRCTLHVLNISLSLFPSICTRLHGVAQSVVLLMAGGCAAALRHVTR